MKRFDNNGNAQDEKRFRKNDNDRSFGESSSSSAFDYHRQRYNDAFRKANDPSGKDYYAEAHRRHRAEQEEAEKKRREEEARKKHEERLFKMTEGTWNQSRGKYYR